MTLLPCPDFAALMTPAGDTEPVTVRLATSPTFGKINGTSQLAVSAAMHLFCSDSGRPRANSVPQRSG